MRRKRSLASVACELLAVLQITGTAFMWGRYMALAEWGRETIGGEHLLLLLPIMYYVGKQMFKDWIADLHELKKGKYLEYGQ